MGGGVGAGEGGGWCRVGGGSGEGGGGTERRDQNVSTVNPRAVLRHKLFYMMDPLG